jgi:hypothetical protein
MEKKRLRWMKAKLETDTSFSLKIGLETILHNKEGLRGKSGRKI